MATIYRIVYQFDAHPNDPQLVRRAEPNDCERMVAYVERRHAEDSFLDENFRFLVLSMTEQEPLLHRPAVRPGARGACYYKVGVLRSGAPIVDVDRD